MKKVKISIVSYSNTIPFVHGLENSNCLSLDSFELSKDTPAICYEKIKNNEADIGLIPVATIPTLNNVKIISDYCIGAEGKVKSVILASHVPLKEIKQVYLDYQSKTSNQLVQTLARLHWKQSFDFVFSKPGYENSINGNKAGVIIGNRALEMRDKFPHVYDLAGEWYDFTGLPFVFACWVQNKEIPTEFINNFNKALQFGISKINMLTADNPTLNSYLTKNINYFLDERKKEAIKLFWMLSKNT